MTNKSSSEFRSVHAAREALSLFVEKNRDINFLNSIPINSIERYDVWLCVFENEPIGFKILQTKELYNMFMKYVDLECPDMTASLCVIIFDRIVESEKQIGLSLREAVDIIIDIFGMKFLSYLKKEAKVSYERRLEIVKPYYEPDCEWVGYAKKVMDVLNEIGE